MYPPHVALLNFKPDTETHLIYNSYTLLWLLPLKAEDVLHHIYGAEQICNCDKQAIRITSKVVPPGNEVTQASVL